MKQILCFFALLLLAPDSISLRANAASLLFTSSNGETISVTADALEAQLGLHQGELYGVTMLSVPTPAEGMLYSEGVEVGAYDYLSRKALASCVFLPLCEETTARLSLLPNAPGGGYTTVALVTSDRSTTRMAATVSAERYAWALADDRYYAASNFHAALPTIIP